MRTFSVIVMVLVTGCGTTGPYEMPGAGIPPIQPIPSLPGSHHHVQPGETLWRIAQSYGLTVQALASANRLSHSGHLDVGQTLFIPLPPETPRFLWPVRGSLRSSSASQGIEIAARPGSLVRASRRGRVAVATRDLSGWGKTVVLDHLDGSFSVYAGLHQIFVAPAADVRQGLPLGSLNTRPLHFEIRAGETPKNTLALLPPP